MPVPSSEPSPSLQLIGAQPTDADERVHPGTRSPMSDAHFDQLRQITKRAQPIERAAGYAKFSGWTTLLAGACSLPFALGNLPMLVFCVVIAGIGTRELTLRRRLLSLETTAPRKLAINQLVLGFSLTGYAVFMLIASPGGSMVESAMQSDPLLQSTPELTGMLDDMASLERLAKAMLYAGMIAVAILVQGGTALYYALRTRALRRLHRHSPDWCVRVYQTMHGC